jgi:hypothetical protein
MKKYLILLFAASGFIFGGCEYFENSDTRSISQLEVNLSGLPTIPDTMTFVGWFDNDDGDPVKAFTLDADANGNLVYSTTSEPLQHLQNAQIFNVTIERKAVLNDSDFVPSGRLILSGRFKLGNASLAFAETVNDFSAYSDSAVFNLSTPTDGPNTNELSGVWFVDSLNLPAGPIAGLYLPALLSGWIYEGWVEVGGVLLSTGRFTIAASSDNFSGYSGSGAKYNYPGEDFLNNPPAGVTFPLDLSNAKVYVTFELDNGEDSGQAPSYKIFEATIPSGAQSGVTYPLQLSSPNLPGGVAKIAVDLLE